MICHIALTMGTEVDVVAEVGDGEVVVEILDEHWGQAPFTNWCSMNDSQSPVFIR